MIKVINKKGFTIIELIVVMAIIGILVLLAVPKFMGHTQKARATEYISNINELEKASERYYLDKGYWPRLSDTPYTSAQITTFAQKIYDVTGKDANLDSNGQYYDIDYASLNSYIKIPSNKQNYILQNPVGNVYGLDNLTAKAETRIEDMQKPVAIITMTPNQTITDSTVISLSYELSTAFKDRTIVDSEWQNKNVKYIVGAQTVKLRVKDSAGTWSDWSEISFSVASGSFTPKTVSSEYTLSTTDVQDSFDFKIDANGNINYFWLGSSYAGVTIYRKVMDKQGNVITPVQTLSTGIMAMNYNVALKSFDVVLDSEDNIYLIYQKSANSTYMSKFNKLGQRIGTEKLMYSKYTGDYIPAYHLALAIYNDNIYFSVSDFGYDGGTGNKIYLVELDKNLNQIGTRKALEQGSSIYEGQLKVTADKIYFMRLGYAYNSGEFSESLNVFNSQLTLLKSITIGTTGRKYVGDMELDTNNILWSVDNMAWNANYNINAYTFDDPITKINKSTSIFGGTISGFVRMEKLKTGELMVMYIQGGALRYKLLSK